MIGYKAFDKNFISLTGYDFKKDGEAIGTVHRHIGEVRVGKSGFHFSSELQDCISYFPITSDMLVCEIEARGDISESETSKKSCGILEIKRRISLDEVRDSITKSRPVYRWSSGIGESKTIF